MNNKGDKMRPELINKIVLRTKLAWGIIVGILVFALLISLYLFYKPASKQNLIIGIIVPPEPTTLAEELVPNIVTINFSQPVAALDQAGKEATKGIKISPAIAGTWIWQGDSSLVFTPKTDWPADQTYTIKFAKECFRPEAKMASLSYKFATAPFQITISDYKFYQNPTEFKNKQVVATLAFNYPVDTNSLESNLALTLEASKTGTVTATNKNLTFKVNYDKHKRAAYITSENLSLPPIPQYVNLIINKGVKSTTGAKTNKAVKRNVIIPDAASYFKIESTNAAIIRNPQNRPEQVLSIETTTGITEQELTNNLHVYLLPKDYPATTREGVKEDYHWQQPGEVTAAILKLTEPVKLEAIPADHDYDTLHHYKFNAPNKRYLYLQITKGTQGFGDYALANDYSTIIKAPSYPKEVSFLHSGSLLALNSEQKLLVLVRGHQQ